MSLALVNYASHVEGRGFEGGQRRLQASLKANSWPAEALFLGPDDLAFPKHVPFAFKPAAIMAAVRAGHSQILWADSSVILQRFPRETLSYLAGNPVLLTSQREPVHHSAGLWASDRCLRQHGLTRDAAMDVHGFMGGFLGINLEFQKGREFLERWWAASRDGESFVGGGVNEHGVKDTVPVSSDPRCQGHRHDQISASIIGHFMGLKTCDYQQFVSEYNLENTEWSFQYV